MSYLEARTRFNQVFDLAFIWLFARLRVFVNQVGEITGFASKSIRLIFRQPLRIQELISHMEFVGNQSVTIICLSAVFTGMALAFQLFLGFKQLNASGMVGSIVALAIFRELGPVLTGLIVAARAGGAMAARLGTMRVTEQIDALEVMGVDPLQYLVSPRILASVLVMPLLCGVFDFISMIGSWMICIHLLEMDEAQYWERINVWIKPSDIFQGLFKAALFGLFFSIICTHRGYNTKGGAAGVGSSTNRGVVLSMVMIIIIDFFATNIIKIFLDWKEVLLR